MFRSLFFLLALTAAPPATASPPTPPPTPAPNHPLGGRLMIRLVKDESNLKAETALARQLVEEGEVEMVGEPLWDQTTKTAFVSWQKTLGGKVIMKGAILVGPAPNPKMPLLFAYVGGWKAELDDLLGPLLAQAFNARGLTPIEPVTPTQVTPPEDAAREPQPGDEDTATVAIAIKIPNGWAPAPDGILNVPFGTIALSRRVGKNPLAGLMTVGLIAVVEAETDLRTELRITKTALEQVGVEIVGKPIINEKDQTAVLAWRHKTPKGILKGRLAIGPIPGHNDLPLRFVYRGQWFAKLDAKLGPLFDKAFRERGLEPISQ